MKPEPPYSPSSDEATATRSRVRLSAAFIAAAAIGAVGSLILCLHATPFYSGLFFVPFAFGPLVVTLGLSFLLRCKHAQRLLTISSLAYAAWFGYIYLQAFYLNPDPQSPIAFLFVGVYALPVLVVFWIAAGVMQWRGTMQSAESPMHGSAF